MMQGCKPSALAKSGMLVAAMKKLRALSLVVLRDAITVSGSKPYIEMVLWSMVHLPLRKRSKMYMEEDTRPGGAPAEEVAKIIAALILRKMVSQVTSS